MATIFLKAAADVEIAPQQETGQFGVIYRPLGTTDEAWELLQTDVATKGIDTNYLDFVTVRVSTEIMPPASAVAAVTVIADYTVQGGGGVVYRAAALSIDTSGERHYDPMGGLFLTMGTGEYPPLIDSASSLVEFTPYSEDATVVTDTATFPSTRSTFNSVRFYVAGSVDMFLTSSNDSAAAAEIWEMNPCPVSAFALPDHGGKTFGYVDFMIQFNDLLYICATSTDDTTFSVFTSTDGTSATWVRDLTGGRASGVSVRGSGTVLCVFNGSKVEEVTTGGVWSSTSTGVTDVNPNTITYGNGDVYFATFRSGGAAHVPNIYTWNGTTLTTIPPATTGIVDDDKVVVCSMLYNYWGDLIYLWALKGETWSDEWYSEMYVGMRNTAWYPQAQTIDVPIGKTGFYATSLSNPMVSQSVIPYNYAGPNGQYAAFATQYYVDGVGADGAVIYDTQAASYPPTFAVVSGLEIAGGVPQAFATTPWLKFADATGTQSWTLTTVPCSGAAWTQASVDAIESIGFHLESFVGSTLILNRLGIEVDYTPIAITRNNKGCLNFLVS